MNKFIIDLFKDENTVIIPGFGALTMVNRSTNELMFMSFMKHNDGTLVNYIAEKKGVDSAEAKLEVEAFVLRLNSTIDAGQRFTLEGVGSFYKDASGEVQFDAPADEVTPNADKLVTVEPIVVEEPVVVSSTETVEPPVEEVIEELATQEEKESVSEEQESIKEEIIEPIIIQESVESDVLETKMEEPPIDSTVKVASEEEQWNDDLDLPPLNYKPEQPKKPILEKTKKDKKRRGVGSMMLIILALVIFGAATFVGLNYSELKEKIPFLASEEKNSFDRFKEHFEEEVNDEGGNIEEVIPTDEQLAAEQAEIERLESESKIELANANKDAELAKKEAELAKKESEKAEKEASIAKAEALKQKEEEKKKSAPVSKTPATPKVVTSGNLTYDKSKPVQVIVGSFGLEANANRLIEKLNKLGYPASIYTVSGGLHTVSAASFNSMEEFQANKSSFDKVGNYWVKK